MKRNQKGFTIIEVVLVLAIAGLIFLMVFIALPALQRSQRNTQRKNDLSRIATAATSYQSNNNGITPFEQTTGYYYDADPNDNINNLNDKQKILKSFIDRYIVAGGDYGSQFADPDGEYYRFTIRSKNWYGSTYAVGDTAPGAADENNAHRIVVTIYAKCGAAENTIVRTSGKHDFALIYTLEGNSVTCADNQ
jgi:prepilin-type N-terminal cleavage/methylation domain-containing protein